MTSIEEHEDEDHLIESDEHETEDVLSGYNAQRLGKVDLNHLLQAQHKHTEHKIQIPLFQVHCNL